MKKQNFSVMCPDALFMKITLGPPEHENHTRPTRVFNTPCKQAISMKNKSAACDASLVTGYKVSHFRKMIDNHKK
jgi:hypothetical protein